jgi:hypothetical protein
VTTRLCPQFAEYAADAASPAGFDMAVPYRPAYGQGTACAGSTETGRVDRDQAVGFAPGARQGRPAAHLGLPMMVDLGGPAMARIARDYGHTIAELRKL